MVSGGETVYLAPVGEVASELREKGSRFLAVVGAVSDAASAKQRIAELAGEHTGASHLCWAWRLGRPPRERHFDAGEPAGTAGVPMLQVLRGAELSDVLAVVVRWFGGIKLGKGGLARAYAKVVQQAVATLPVDRRQSSVELRLTLRYEQLGVLKRLIHPPEVELIEEVYSAQIEVTLRAFRARLAVIEQSLADAGITSVVVAPGRSDV